MNSWRFKPYVSVGQRRAKAQRKLAQLAKKGHVAAPVEIEGRAIATTFWGKSWCEHLEAYSDFASRLPRGRTYVRNGSVIDLRIEGGQVTALVSGSEIYQVTITIQSLKKAAWDRVRSRCGGQIGSLVELLEGRLSHDVMQVVTHRDEGLFPKPKEISMRCTCPDWAGMCKHLAATLYGVGARLDREPELLFVLRQVDHRKLVDGVREIATISKTKRKNAAKELAVGDLAEIFRVDIDVSASNDVAPTGKARRRSSPHAARQIVAAGKSTTKRRKRAALKPKSSAAKEENLSGKLDQRKHPATGSAPKREVAASARRKTPRKAAKKPPRSRDT